jgi:ribosomal protein S18 acetylase RimI-like enzyme
MDVRFKIDPNPAPKSEAVLALFERAGILFPNWTVERMDRALKSSSVVVCAWSGNELIGFARAISDFAWCAYLSQLCVAPQFQNRGIGKRLVALVVQQLGQEVSLLVHSAESATGFYQAVGFELYSNVYRMNRKK